MSTSQEQDPRASLAEVWSLLAGAETDAQLRAALEPHSAHWFVIAAELHDLRGQLDELTPCAKDFVLLRDLPEGAVEQLLEQTADRLDAIGIHQGRESLLAVRVGVARISRRLARTAA